jgi:hypothetical protein
MRPAIEGACGSHADDYGGSHIVVSHHKSFFQLEEQWASGRIQQPLIQIRLTEPSDEAIMVVRSVLGEVFGLSIDAAFVTRDREQVFAYVSELTDPILDRVFTAEQELSKKLYRQTELHLVAHQGRPFPSDQRGMDRAI